VQSLQAAIAALSLLRSLKSNVKRQRAFIDDLSVRDVVRTYYRENEVSRRELGQTLDEELEALRNALMQMEDRIEELTSKDSGNHHKRRGSWADVGDASSWQCFQPRGMRGRIHTGVLHQGLTLAIPPMAQYKLRHHWAITRELQGRVCGREIPVVSPGLQFLKGEAYKLFHVTQVGGFKNRLSRTMLMKIRTATTIFSATLLVFVCFYVFLYAVELQDNTVIEGVLWNVFFALLVEILITGPIIVFLVSGVGPAFAASILHDDVTQVFGRSDLRDSIVTSAKDGVSDDVLEVVEPEKHAQPAIKEGTRLKATSLGAAPHNSVRLKRTLPAPNSPAAPASDDILSPPTGAGNSSVQGADEEMQLQTTSWFSHQNQTVTL